MNTVYFTVIKRCDQDSQDYDYIGTMFVSFEKAILSASAHGETERERDAIKECLWRGNTFVDAKENQISVFTREVL